MLVAWARLLDMPVQQDLYQHFGEVVDVLQRILDR